MKKNFVYFMLFLFANTAIAQGFWNQKSDFGGVARYRSQGVSIGNKGYFMGGALDGVPSTKDFWEFDPATNTWTQKSDFPGTARGGSGMTSFELNGKGYFGLGAYWSGGPNDYTIYNDFYMYDPATNTWTQKADFPGTGRTSQVNFTINNKGYVATGVTLAGVFLNDLWEYDPIADTWTQKMSFGSTGRANGVAFDIDGKGYAGMGRNNSLSAMVDFWEYNPGTNTWVQKSDFGGGARVYLTGMNIAGYGYAGLGSDGSAYKNDWWRYDPSTNSWAKKSDFPGNARILSANFSTGNKGYIGTGYATFYTKDFYEFTPENYGTDEISELNTLIYFQQNTSTLIVNTRDLSEVKIFDISGKTVLAKSYNHIDEVSLDLNDLPNGTFIVRILSSDQVVCKKIVKVI